jgi:hypothetical protein
MANMSPLNLAAISRRMQWMSSIVVSECSVVIVVLADHLFGSADDWKWVAEFKHEITNSGHDLRIGDVFAVPRPQVFYLVKGCYGNV